MNYVAGVKKVKTFSDIRQLVTGPGKSRIKHDDRRDTYKSKSVHVWTLLDVFREIPAGHPFRDKLERRWSDSQEGNNVWVHQTFIHCSLMVEGL